MSISQGTFQEPLKIARVVHILKIYLLISTIALLQKHYFSLKEMGEYSVPDLLTELCVRLKRSDVDIEAANDSLKKFRLNML